MTKILINDKEKTLSFNSLTSSKNKKTVNISVLFLLVFLYLVSFVYGKGVIKKVDDDFQKLKKTAPKVFIDCQYCDIDYIKTKIIFVNYVVDTRAADVYIMITRLRTGSGGRKYTIKFIGQGKFKGVNDELYYISNRDDTKDTVRKGIVKQLKLGLLQYIKTSKIAKYINIIFIKNAKPRQVKDKWNNWIFNINGGLSQGGEKSYKYKSVYYSIQASRVTEQSRISLRFFKQKSTATFTMNDKEFKSERRSSFLSGIFVGSISEHFSFGGRATMDSSTYFNKKRRIKVAPAVEYDIFPYSKATSKMFRINYSIGIENTEYYETTIYNKDKETLLLHSLLLEFGLKQKWGDASLRIDFSQYFHDMKKYSLEFSGDFSWRIMKGVSCFSYASYSMIHNQLYLPKGTLSPEEIFLRTSALETNYDYRIGIGIKISFGSIYNNAVNPRFGY